MPGDTKTVPNTWRKWPSFQIGDWWIAAVLMLLIAVFSFINPVFFSVENWVNTSTFMSDTLLLAMAETLVILTAGIDLSVGANMGLSSIVFALIMEYGMDNEIAPGIMVPIGIVGGLLAGTLIGWLNGILITRFKVTPFIATLGMLGMCTGLTFILCNGTSVTNLPMEIGEVGNYVLADFLSFPIMVCFVVVAVLYLFLKQTKFGRYTYAIGSNQEAASRAGIQVGRHLRRVYMISGFLAALAGIILVMRFVNGSPLTGSHTELNAIAAVVIGGTSLFGGRGSIWGSVVGACIIAVLLTGLVLAHVQAYWQIVAVGAIIVFAVYVDQLRHKR